MSLRAVRTRPTLGGWAPASIRTPDVALVVVGALTILGFVLRVSQLHQSLLGDEVFTYREVVGQSFNTAVSVGPHSVGIENTPPLFFVLAWAAAKLGDPTVWIRVPSLVFGTATIPLVYAIGRETVGRTAGLIGAAVIAFTPFAVFFSEEARSYATMTFLVALSTLALLRAVRTRSRWWWLLYVGATTAAAYTHYTAIFVLGVQAAWSFWVCRDRLREPLIAHALIALLYLPWLPHLGSKDITVIEQLWPLSVHQVLTDLLRPIPGHPGAPLRAIPTILGLIAVAACVLAGLVAVSARWWRTSKGSTRLQLSSPVTLVVALMAATPIGLLLYSLTVTDLWLPRGLSASLPAAALVLGALLAALPRLLRVIAVAIVMVTLIAGTLRSFDAGYARGPFRAIAERLDAVAGVRDPVVSDSLETAALIVQLHKRHLLLPSTAAMWRTVPPGGTGYLIWDDTIARALRAPFPSQPGFRLVAVRHYAGLLPTDLLTYRRNQRLAG
jgi:uncharacterized membrane protein